MHISSNIQTVGKQNRSIIVILSGKMSCRVIYYMCFSYGSNSSCFAIFLTSKIYIFVCYHI